MIPEYLSGPVAAVQSAVLDGFGDVLDGDIRFGGEVGDGAGDFEDAVVGAGAEALLLHGALEQAFGVGGELAEGANLLSVHLGVGEDRLGRGAGGGFGASRFAVGREGEAGVLALAGGEDASADLGGSFGGCATAQLLILNGGHLYMYVDAVEQRAGDLADVALDHRRSTHALARLVIKISARSRVISL